MISKKLQDVPFSELNGYEKVNKQIVIGPDDGSNEIILRYFSLEPDGTSPHHAHDFPHLVKIEAGNGVITDENGLEHQLKKGDYVFINDKEPHHLKNTGTEPFDFICIVPQRGEE